LLEQQLVAAPGRLEVREVTLALDEGFHFELALEEQGAQLVSRLSGSRTLRELVPDGDSARRAVPLVRRLLELGLLVPV
jgi:hypothetical protein